ncbi:hypothetical protein ABT381_05635 [Streptomyces sp. NPDC000151]|uniref:hypothetical protein n=1 Tax=Streptomyces sp. NPDC000151 TaxID=3154244 RepID=UPI00332246AC
MDSTPVGSTPTPDGGPFSPCPTVAPDFSLSPADEAKLDESGNGILARSFLVCADGSRDESGD